MKELADLITDTNLYMNNNNVASLNPLILKEIGVYATTILRVTVLFLVKKLTYTKIYFKFCTIRYLAFSRVPTLQLVFNHLLE